MKIKSFKISLLFFLIFTSTFSQIGIGNSNPKATLDVTATNPSGTATTVDGIIAPRVDRQRAQSMLLVPVSTLIYVDSIATGTAAGTAINITSTGFYYFNGTLWVKLEGNTKTGTVASTATLVQPNVVFTASSIGSNTTPISIDATSTTRTIAISGFVGTLTNVICNVQLTHNFGGEIDLYLQSPTGQIIELCTDNGGYSPGLTFNVTFSDAAATNITTWTAGSVAGTYRPEGTLTTDVIVPNITTMAGFNGNSPNGTWTLHLRDDAFADNLNFTNFSLTFLPATTINYRLIGETSITYKTGSNVVTNAMYSANAGDEGFITAISRSNASAGAIGTTAVTVPGTVLSYASDSPKQGSGNYWATTYNQSVSNGLVNGTTYYFQLWAKGNIDTPTASNEIFSLIPMMLPQ
jgi:subtilisin-like proprotein convertase family protein